MGEISAVLTAAGESTRMGSPKPLLLWHGVSLVQYQVSCLFDVGVSDVIVVLGHRADVVVPYVEKSGARHVINPHYREGKTTSIKAGLKCVSSDADAVLYLAVDQPRTKEIIAQVIASHFSSNALITSPRYDGHGGHPLIFSTALRAELEQISEEKRGIREVFQAHLNDVHYLAIDDPIIRLDLNTPEAYRDAKEKYGA